MFLFLLCAPPPSYATDNPETLYQQGIKYGRQKNYDAAIESLNQALTLSPKNQDYRLALARVHSWKGDTETAHTLVDETLAMQPDNIEAQILKARLYYYQQKFTDAQPMLQQVITDDPDNEEAGALLKQVQKARKVAQQARQAKKQKKKPTPAKPVQPAKKEMVQPTPEKSWILATGLERSTLSRRPQPDWKQHFIQLGYKVTNDLTTHVRYENTERFHTHNEYIELGADYKFSDSMIGYAAIGHTDKATFIPEFRLKAGGQARVIHMHEHLGDTWLTLDTQYDRFDGNIEIKTIKPGLSYNFLDDFTLSGKHVNILDDDGTHLHGWSARMDWQTPWDRLRLNAGFSDTSESDNRTTVVTKSRSFSAVFDINEDVTLYLSYARDDRENSFIRKIISSAFVFRF